MHSNRTEVDMCDLDKVLHLTSADEASKYVIANTERLAVTAGLLAVLAFGLPGNFAFLFVVYKVSYMRTITNFFLANVAVADVLFLIVTFSMYMAYMWASPLRSDYNAASIFSCVGVFVVPHITYFMSICTLTVVAMERYYAICKPIKHRAIASRARAVRLVLTCVVLALILTTLDMPKYGLLDAACIIWPDGEQYRDLPQTVGFCRPVVSWWVVVSELVTVFPFLVALPCNLFMYLRIVKTLRSLAHNKPGKQHSVSSRAVQVRSQVAKMVVINGLVFFLSQTVNQSVSLIEVITTLTGVSTSDDFERLMANLGNVGRIMVFVNSAVNPFIYTAFSPHYRAAFKHAFGCSLQESKHTQDVTLSAIIKSQATDVDKSSTTENGGIVLDDLGGVYCGIDNQVYKASPLNNVTRCGASNAAAIDI